jgi:hypothetical protein
MMPPGPVPLLHTFNRARQQLLDYLSSLIFCIAVDSEAVLAFRSAFVRHVQFLITFIQESQPTQL